MTDQLEFNFKIGAAGGAPGETGSPLFAEREAAIRRLEDRFGLILNKKVRVTLFGFPGEFAGKITLDQLILPEGRKDELRLRLGHMAFDYGDIESCVLIDP